MAPPEHSLQVDVGRFAGEDLCKEMANYERTVFRRIARVTPVYGFLKRQFPDDLLMKKFTGFDWFARAPVSVRSEVHELLAKAL